jgi:hypothetical protein
VITGVGLWGQPVESTANEGAEKSVVSWVLEIVTSPSVEAVCLRLKVITAPVARAFTVPAQSEESLAANPDAIEAGVENCP